MPAISIIVPVFNAEKYLRRCVDSILAQTYRDIELLLIDDGSTDGSPSICDEYAARDLRVKVCHKENAGVSAARNQGIRLASGEWIGFADADDWLNPEMYASMISSAQKTGADMLYCDFTAVNKDGEVPVKQPANTDDNVALAKAYIMGGWTVVWDTLVKRLLITDHDLYFDENIRYGEDFTFLMKAFLTAYKIEHVEKPLYYYNRTNENSALRNLHFDYYRQIITAVGEVIDFAKKRCHDEELDKMLGWKILRGKQDLVLYPDKHREFCSIRPEYHKHISSCPWIGSKIKMLMWMLTHHMRPAVVVHNYLRFIRTGSNRKY